MRSVSSARLRCARAVSGRHPAPRPRDRRPRQARLLASLSPPADRPRVPCLRRACRLQPAHLVAWRPRNHRRCKLARTRPEKPVRTPGGSGRLGCSRLSRRPPIAPGSPRPTRGDLGSRVSYAHVRRKTSRPRAHPPSAASRRRSLRFAQWRRHVRQQDASRDCQEWCASPDVPHWTKSAGTIPPRMLCLFGAKL
jgi:hypothetical protein